MKIFLLQTTSIIYEYIKGIKTPLQKSISKYLNKNSSHPLFDPNCIRLENQIISPILSTIANSIPQNFTYQCTFIRIYFNIQLKYNKQQKEKCEDVKGPLQYCLPKKNIHPPLLPKKKTRKTHIRQDLKLPSQS